MQAIYNLLYSGIVASARVDLTRRGYHVVAWLRKPISHAEAATLRTLLGDDGQRLRHDSRRPFYLRNVLFSRKGDFIVRKDIRFP